MDALHGGDDAELGEARDVRGVQVLRVLHPPPKTLQVRVGHKGTLEDVQGFPIGAVADGVDAELKPVLGRKARGLVDLGHRRGLQPCTRGEVVVGLEEPRAVGPQRAVDGLLDGPHGEAVIPVPDHAVRVQLVSQLLVGGPEHDPHPDLQGAVVHHLLHEVHGLETGTRILEGGDALGEGLLLGEENHTTGIHRGRVRAAPVPAGPKPSPGTRRWGCPEGPARARRRRGPEWPG